MKSFIKYLFATLSFYIAMISFAKAQQDAMFSQYIFNKMVINPAFAGSSEWVIGTMQYRSQFVGIKGAPVTQTLTGEFPILLRHMGVGLKVINDKAGVVRQSSMVGVYSYHIKVGKGKFSLGLENGVINQAIDFSSLARTDQGDVNLPLGKESIIVYDATFGLCYQTKTFYAGVSAFHITQSKLKFSNALSTLSGISAHLFNHNYFIIGNVFSLNKEFAVEPSLLAKQVNGAPIQVDVNLNAIYQKRLCLGFSYRTGDAMVILLKLNATENVRIGYSYDITLSKLAGFSQGAHELLVSYGKELYARDSSPVPRY